MKEFVMVLNDEETWTNLHGCKILVFDHEPTDEEVKHPDVSNVLAQFVETADGETQVRWVELRTLCWNVSSIINEQKISGQYRVNLSHRFNPQGRYSYIPDKKDNTPDKIGE